MTTKIFNNHRENVRNRFMISAGSLGDYELLEMLLFLAIPRKDTKALAKALLEKFGSLGSVLNADRDRLMDMRGLGKAVSTTVQLFHELVLRMLRDDVRDKNIEPLRSLEKYCRIRIGHLVHEEVLALFLNGSLELVAEDIINSGDWSETKIYSNILITRATQNGARSIILAHNHPSGDPNPSRVDLETTRNLNDLLVRVGLELLDHLIVTPSKSFSFSGAGLLIRQT
jgi:DNA repair protein RadC